MKKSMVTAMFLVLVMGISVLAGVSGYSVTVEADPAEISVGENATVTADWAAGQNGMHFYQWFVDGKPIPDSVSFDVGGRGNPSSGKASYVFPGTTAGTFTISFKIWHDSYPTQSDRFASGAATVVVLDIEEGDAPAAPAVAGRILRENGIKNNHPEYKNYIAQVADQGTTEFRGVPKEDTDAFYIEIYKFLQEIGVDLPDLLEE